MEMVTKADGANVKPDIASNDESTTSTFVDEEFPKENMSVRTIHPLQFCWTWWYLKADRTKDWSDCLKPIGSFDKVEEFWAIHDHILAPSNLNHGSDYYIFKSDIKPMWEHPKNLNGGRWVVTVKHQKSGVDTYWLELLMAMIGEQFDGFGEYICGASVNVRRKGDKVSLWTSDCSMNEANLRIGHLMKEKLVIPDSTELRYEVHKELEARTGSTIKPLWVLPATPTVVDPHKGDKRL